ncbi:hypothetical protein C0J52_20180 [Blattella germanica]|nr:hypothetical protein C0J52_20180 [Blattella germanica]
MIDSQLTIQLEHYDGLTVKSRDEQTVAQVLFMLTMYVLERKERYNNYYRVSWIRMRDLQILTSDTITFTSDSRFEILHSPGSEMWTLRIMSVQPRDQGKYECQVNTDPKINFAVMLAIRETDMKDDPDHENIPATATATGNFYYKDLCGIPIKDKTISVSHIKDDFRELIQNSKRSVKFVKVNNYKRQLPIFNPDLPKEKLE